MSIGIDVIEEIDGNLPKRQRRLVEAWAELHQTELMNNWRRLSQGDDAEKIEPLR